MENRGKKAYLLIISTVSEEVIQHIMFAKNSYDALKKSKYLYGSHSIGANLVVVEAIQPRVEGK